MEQTAPILKEPTHSLLRSDIPSAKIACVCDTYGLPKFPAPVRYVSNIIAVLKSLAITVGNRDPSQLQEIHKGVYEGGFLLWECERDCLTYLQSQFEAIKQEVQTRHYRALEIGCGSGLVGIALLQAGVQTVVFQDYNPEVLQYWTAVNVGLNFGQNKLQESCSFVKGDWANLQQELEHDVIKTTATPGLANEKYDLIVGCDVIYETKNYKTLLDLFAQFLSPTGRVLIASKAYYYGNGGSLAEFKALVTSDTRFTAQQVFLVPTGGGNRREVIQLTFRT